MKLLIVSVGRGRYAVPADTVVRIVDPALETGFRQEDSTAHYRGERLPVLDLHTLTGEDRRSNSVYLLLQGQHRRTVVAVDGTETIREVAAGDIAPLPDYIFARSRRAFRGVFLDGGELCLLVDEDGIP